MTGPESISQQLRERTRAQHRRAEMGRLEQLLVRGRVDRLLYCAYLAQRYHVHSALEALLREAAARDARIGDIAVPALFQEMNLRRDLEFLCGATFAIEPLPATRRLHADLCGLADRARCGLLGADYVFEGSKNGARYIAERIGPALGLLRAAPGLLYLDPHGALQGALWQDFKQRLDVAEFSRAEQQVMIEAACATFECVAEMDDEILAACGSARNATETPAAEGAAAELSPNIVRGA